LYVLALLVKWPKPTKAENNMLRRLFSTIGGR